MKTMMLLLAVLLAGQTTLAGEGGAMIKLFSVEQNKYVEVPKVVKTDAEWKKILKPEEYDITRKAGTERAFTGPLWDNHREGIYKCVGCGSDLFYSTDKFESGTGWPSFTKPVARENVSLREDRSWFSVRTEVLCALCDAHLGHVFDDGPPPTGLRYCMNSWAMKFAEKGK